MTLPQQVGRTVWTDRPIRELNIVDLPHCLALADNRGWQREDHKWRFLFAHGTVYGIDDPAGGGLAGVVVSTRFGARLAGIGMMLVADRYERQGLGARLMRHAIRRVDAATVWLTATEYGRPLYERLGFRAIDTISQYVGYFQADGAPERSRPATDADLPAIRAMDAEVFGGDRADVLRALPSFADEVRLVEGPHGPTGYAAAWRNVSTTVIGPIVADDIATARALITDLAVRAAGPIRLDLVHSQPAQLAWAREHALRDLGSTTAMIHGADLPGDRDRLFGPLTVAMG